MTEASAAQAAREEKEMSNTSDEVKDAMLARLGAALAEFESGFAEMPIGRMPSTLTPEEMHKLREIRGSERHVILDAEPDYTELRAALADVPSGVASGDAPEWLVRLHRAACAVLGVEVGGGAP